MRRYLKMAELNVISAINTAAEEAWEIALSDIVPSSEGRELIRRLNGQVKACKKCGKEKKTICYCEDCDARD